MHYTEREVPAPLTIPYSIIHLFFHLNINQDNKED